MADTLAALLAELQAMPPRARRSILRELSPAERMLLDARLQEAAVEPGTSGETDQRFSPWLDSCVHAARTETGGTRMTSATRQALLRSVDAITGVVPTKAADPHGSGRSLFDTVNGLLSPRRMRL